jgi:hypothetical protein
MKCSVEGREVIFWGGLEIEAEILRERRWSLEGVFVCVENGRVVLKTWFGFEDGCEEEEEGMVVVKAVFAAIFLFGRDKLFQTQALK